MKAPRWLRWRIYLIERRITIFLHPFFHGDSGLPASSFQTKGGCPLCRYNSWRLPRDVKERLANPFPDESLITVSEETETHRGIQMSATAKRQLEAILAEHPGEAEKLAEAIDRIAKK